MNVRLPCVATMFYPGGPAPCRRQIETMMPPRDAFQFAEAVRGVLVPHAGWAYSGATATRGLVALGASGEPETVVLFGAVHRWGLSRPALYGAGAWRTPIGDVLVDEELAREVLRLGGEAVVDDPDAHAEEHSIEVQLPILRYLYPQARILPVATPPVANAAALGQVVARAATLLGRKAVAVGSSDLTHYGPRYGNTPAGVGAEGLAWTRTNDKRLIDLAVGLRVDEIMDEAEAHHNACGPGALAAAMAFSRELGATRGLLLNYTTSYDAWPEGLPSDVVGYGAVAFL
jgi:AmmeMemoRadiSam system protein B